jgi:hypothetical protein
VFENGAGESYPRLALLAFAARSLALIIGRNDSGNILSWPPNKHPAERDVVHLRFSMPPNAVQAADSIAAHLLRLTPIVHYSHQPGWRNW